MNGAEAVLTSLKNEGVDVVFGYPGGAVLTLYDAVYKMKFPHILTRHEQGAVHAADGYARATGKVGVVFATSGPGATNLVTGISTAYTDSVPLVCITGQVANPYIGKDSFQEADVCGITTPITKHNYLVKKVEDLPRVLKEAFYIARTGVLARSSSTWPRMSLTRNSTTRIRRRCTCAATAARTSATRARSTQLSRPSVRPRSRSSLRAAAS